MSFVSFSLAVFHYSLPSTTAAQQPLEGAEWGWSSFKAPSLENCHNLTWLMVLWKNPLVMLSLFYPTQSSSSASSLFPRGVCWKYQRQLLNIMAAWDSGIRVGTNNRLTKKLKRKIWGMDTHRGLWKSPPYSWESRRSCKYVALCACPGLRVCVCV